MLSTLPDNQNRQSPPDGQAGSIQGGAYELKAVNEQTDDAFHAQFCLLAVVHLFSSLRIGIQNEKTFPRLIITCESTSHAWQNGPGRRSRHRVFFFISFPRRFSEGRREGGRGRDRQRLARGEVWPRDSEREGDRQGE